MSPVDLTDERTRDLQMRQWMHDAFEAGEIPATAKIVVLDVIADATGTDFRLLPVRPYDSLDAFAKKEPRLGKFAEEVRHCQLIYQSACIAALWYPPDGHDARPWWRPDSQPQ